MTSPDQPAPKRVRIADSMADLDRSGWHRVATSELPGVWGWDIGWKDGQVLRQAVEDGRIISAQQRQANGDFWLLARLPRMPPSMRLAA